MPSSSVGAVVIEKEAKQLFNCVIKKIHGAYTDADKKKQTAVLYDHSEYKNNCKISDLQSTKTKGLLISGISNFGHELNYYFLSDHKGRELTLSCQQEINSCDDRAHRVYTRDYIDITTRELKSETKLNSNDVIKLYYYDLNYRAKKYAKQTASFIHKNVKVPTMPDKVILSGAGYLGGKAVGSVVDFLNALRFIHLPIIKDSDYDYENHTSLYYSHCQSSDVPTICIHIYPDIKYSFELGFSGSERTYYADTSKQNTTENSTLNFEFNVEYASFKQKLELGNSNETVVDEDIQKGTRFYKTINKMADFFKGAADMAGNLKQLFDSANNDKNNSISKDLESVKTTNENIGFALSNSGNWLKGQISINPKISAEWEYKVTDDLVSLQRHIKMSLGIECEGELSIDLVRLTICIINKGKDATTIAATAAAIGSGGLAAIPAILIKLLVDTIVKWLIKKFTDGIHVDLIFIARAGFDLFSYDSLEDTKLDGLCISAGLEFRLDIGLKYKSSIQITTIVEIGGEMKLMGHTVSSVDLKFFMSIDKGILCLNQNCNYTPFSVKIEYGAVGSYQIFSFTGKTGSTHTKKWKFGEKECDPVKYELFELYSSTK